MILSNSPLKLLNALIYYIIIINVNKVFLTNSVYFIMAIYICWNQLKIIQSKLSRTYIENVQLYII